MKNEKAKNTPGPWTYKKGQTFKDERGNYPPQEIKVPQGLYTIYHQVKPDGAVYWAHADLIDSEEDARLIAAAPELLAALEWALKNIEEIALPEFDKKGAVTSLNSAADKARAAIAKAKGGR